MHVYTDWTSVYALIRQSFGGMESERMLTPRGEKTLYRKNRLVGLVVKASASRAEDPGFESRLRRDFFGVESYQ